MKIGFTTDSNLEAGISEIKFGANSALREFFNDRFYDDSGVEFFFVLMCREPKLDFKQRIRFARKENVLYADIMLDLEQMKHVDVQAGRRIVAEKMLNQIPEIISRCRFDDFDISRFMNDLREWFIEYAWLN